MKLSLIGCGQGGGHLVNMFRRFEARTMQHVTETTTVIDTASAPMSELSRVKDKNKHVVAQSTHNSRGTAGEIVEGAEAIHSSLSQWYYDIKNQTSNFTDIDAFLLIGALGGGTGGGGLPIIAETLQEKHDIPIYAVGILPSNDEPPLYHYNAAKSLQSLGEPTHNIILVDNDHFDVADPQNDKKFRGLPSDSRPPREDVFNAVNQEIARSLHFLFTADEIKSPSHLSSTTTNTSILHNMLQTGGISALGYHSDPLPKSARPGIIGTIRELAHRHKHNKQQQQNAQAKLEETRDDETDPEEDDRHPFDTYDYTPPEYDNFPYPHEVLNETFDVNNLSIDCDTQHAGQYFLLLIGPSKFLNGQTISDIRKELEDYFPDSPIATANYPKKSKNMAGLTLFSDIPLPDKIFKMNEVATKMKEKRKEERESKPTNRNVFEEMHSDVEPLVQEQPQEQTHY